MTGPAPINPRDLRPGWSDYQTMADCHECDPDGNAYVVHFIGTDVDHTVNRVECEHGHRVNDPSSDGDWQAVVNRQLERAARFCREDHRD